MTTKLTEIGPAEKEDEILFILHQTRILAARYYLLTGKPLGVTGEIAEYEAAKRLGLILADARSAHFDAYRDSSNRREFFQIKGRAVSPLAKYRGRVPKIRCDGQFDAVLLVLLDKTTYEAIEIWQAPKAIIESRLTAAGSKARNERGSLEIAQFKSISIKVWSCESKQ